MRLTGFLNRSSTFVYLVYTRVWRGGEDRVLGVLSLAVLAEFSGNCLGNVLSLFFEIAFRIIPSAAL